MKLLLDTHALVWWVTNSPKLSKTAREQVAARQNTVFVSAASAWEIATKARIGRWPDAAALVALFPGVIEANGMEPLAITVRHANHAGSLAVAFFNASVSWMIALQTLKCRADQHAAESAICGENKAPFNFAIFEGDVIDIPSQLIDAQERYVQERALLS